MFIFEVNYLLPREVVSKKGLKRFLGKFTLCSIFSTGGLFLATQRTLPYCFLHGVRFRSVLLLCSEFTTHGNSLLKT